MTGLSAAALAAVLTIIILAALVAYLTWTAAGLKVELEVARGLEQMEHSRAMRERRRKEGAYSHLDGILVAMRDLTEDDPASQAILDAALVRAIHWRETEPEGGAIGVHPARWPTTDPRRPLP